MTQQELDAVVVALDDALKIMARPTTAALRSRLGWSRQKTYEAIREAVRLGMIERVGVTKWTWFRMPFRREHEFRDRLHAAMYRAKERDETRAEVERLRVELIRAGSRECDIAACNCGTWHHQSPRAAYRRGAEAMREACAREVVEGRLGVSPDDVAWLNDIASDVRALPIPEEP